MWSVYFEQIGAAPLPFSGLFDGISEGLAPCRRASTSAKASHSDSGSSSTGRDGGGGAVHGGQRGGAGGNGQRSGDGGGGGVEEEEEEEVLDGGGEWHSAACRDAAVHGTTTWALRQMHGFGNWVLSALSDLTDGATKSGDSDAAAAAHGVWDRPAGLSVQHALSLTASELMTALTEEPEALTLVYVHATWCPFSAEVAPLVLLYFTQRPGLRLVFVDGSTSPSLNSRYGVHGFPTLVLLRGPTLLGRFSGPQRYSEIGVFVEQTLNITDTALEEAIAAEAKEVGGGLNVASSAQESWGHITGTATDSAAVNASLVAFSTHYRERGVVAQLTGISPQCGTFVCPADVDYVCGLGVGGARKTYLNECVMKCVGNADYPTKGACSGLSNHVRPDSIPSEATAKAKKKGKVKGGGKNKNTEETEKETDSNNDEVKAFLKSLAHRDAIKASSFTVHPADWTVSQW